MEKWLNKKGGLRGGMMSPGEYVDGDMGAVEEGRGLQGRGEKGAGVRPVQMGEVIRILVMKRVMGVVKLVI